MLLKLFTRFDPVIGYWERLKWVSNSWMNRRWANGWKIRGLTGYNHSQPRVNIIWWTSAAPITIHFFSINELFSLWVENKIKVILWRNSNSRLLYIYYIVAISSRYIQFGYVNLVLLNSIPSSPLFSHHAKIKCKIKTFLICIQFIPSKGSTCR